MPLEIPENIKRHGHRIWRGLLVEFAPDLFKGLLVGLLAKSTLQGTIRWINENVTLWEEISTKDKVKIKRFVEPQHLEWMTVDWVIDALRKDRPDIASLFLNWPKAREWLERQISTIKKETHSR